MDRQRDGVLRVGNDQSGAAARVGMYRFVLTATAVPAQQLHQAIALAAER